jgi:hypothetical protein
MFFIDFSCKLSNTEKNIYNEKDHYTFNNYRYSSSNIQKIFYYFMVEKNRNLIIHNIKDDYKKTYQFNESDFHIIKLFILDFIYSDIEYIFLVNFLCDITVSINIEFRIVNNIFIPLSMKWNTSVLFKDLKTTIVTNYMYNVFNEIITVLEKDINYNSIYKKLLLYTKLKILFSKMEDIKDLVNNVEYIDIIE